MIRLRKSRMELRRKRAFVVDMQGDVAKAAVEAEDPEYVAKAGTNSPEEVFVVADTETDESTLVNGINDGSLEIDRSETEDFGGKPHATVKPKKAKAEEKPKPKKVRKPKAKPELTTEESLDDLFNVGDTDGAE